MAVHGDQVGDRDTVISGEGHRSSWLFDRWHASLTSTAEKLLTRAQEANTVRADLTVAEVLTLVNAVAAAQTDVDQARRLLDLLGHGLNGPAATG
ncbi:hypothetical protein GCM10022254_15470 [Actinomadura meridiana]|uniref:Transcriptional regulator SbtR-like C-terminal domain-containing protein n=1 Tax=Actinomadura meridiana TaxID=559626 RepID=A0ABP8BVG0_9ACTN